MTDKKIIVTGGAGFIGLNLVEALNDLGRTDIVVVDDLNNEIKEQNLAKLRYETYLDKTDFLNQLKRDEIDDVGVIFHLGACTDTTNADKDYMYQNNTEFSKQIFEWCAKHQVRLIYASSAATYGDGSKGFLDTNREIEPLNLYGDSKYRFDEYVLDAREKPIQWAGLKFFNVFGPGEGHKGKMASMVYQAAKQARESGKIRLFKSSNPEYPDGQEKRDFIYVKDIVKIILFFFIHPEQSGIYNAGTGKARSFLDLAKAVFAALGKKPNLEFFNMPVAIRGKYQYFTEADISRLRSVGYQEKFFELEDAIKDYIKHDMEAN